MPLGPYPYIVRDREAFSREEAEKKEWDPNLRSTNVVSGYHIQASDGEIGNVEDFIVDDQTWAIRYLISIRGTGGREKRYWFRRN